MKTSNIISVIYIHGKGGSASECEFYTSLFPGNKVTGLDYKTFTPWETGTEIHDAVKALYDKGSVIIIANSIGAYFAMNADIEDMIQKAYFISPVVDMQKLIREMMYYNGITEEELKEKGAVTTLSGDEISWKYLSYVKDHPVKWDVPTEILYASGDFLTPYETVADFALKHNAHLTVMDGGEHWFHTDAQMQFLYNWIKNN